MDKLYSFLDSKIDGTGVIAESPFRLGDIVGTGFVKVTGTGNVDDDYRRTDLGKYLNHSDNPNVELFQMKDSYFIRAKIDIQFDDELTIDYNTFPWEGKKEF